MIQKATFFDALEVANIMDVEKKKVNSANMYIAITDDSRKSLKELDEKIEEKDIKVKIADDLYSEIAAKADSFDYFDMIVDLRYENQTLRDKIQELQKKLQQAYDFMKQFVISGRNLLDIFCEQIGEIKDWFMDKVVTRNGRAQ